MPLTLFPVVGNSGSAMAIGKIACLEVVVDGAVLETNKLFGFFAAGKFLITD